MSKLRERVEPVLMQHGVKCAIIATKEGEELVRLGDFDRLEYGDLLRLLLGGKAEIATLYISLEGRILPQTYRQGPVECVVSRTGRFVYGLFVVRGDDVKADYLAKKRLREAIDRVLAHLDCETDSIEGESA